MAESPPESSRNDHDSCAPLGPGPILQEQYQKIGVGLNQCEARFIGCGIPVLPPTKRARALRRKVDPPIADFLRMSLVGVSTPALIAYAEDLDELPLDALGGSVLVLYHPRLWERYWAVIIVASLVFAASILISTRGLTALPMFQDVTGFVITSFMSLLAAPLCSERLRRMNFASLIRKEIRRRQGTRRRRRRPASHLDPPPALDHPLRRRLGSPACSNELSHPGRRRYPLPLGSPARSLPPHLHPLLRYRPYLQPLVLPPRAGRPLYLLRPGPRP